MINEIDPHNISGLKREDFQSEIKGKKTDLFILKNEKGSEIAVTNYGGAILSIMVPDKNGKFANVIQGHDTLQNVINSPEPFLSTLIGRYGNRIKEGQFTLDGKVYQLAINNGPNSLHGGPTGFHTRVWEAMMIDPQCLELHYTSSYGEEGFPGELNMTVRYTLSDEDAFIIEYRGFTNRRTIVNMTHHGFFSLSGITNPTATIDNVICTINADHYIPIDENSIPLGSVDPVDDTPFDFRKPHALGERIYDKTNQQIINGTGYDHCYVLNKHELGELSFAAKIIEPVSGRTMEVYTTEPGVQLYTGNWLNGFTGWHGATFPARSAVCFEAQHFPDSPNRPYFPTVVLNPGETYRQRTIYKFGIIDE